MIGSYEIKGCGDCTIIEYNDCIITVWDSRLMGGMTIEAKTSKLNNIVAKVVDALKYIKHKHVKVSTYEDTIITEQIKKEIEKKSGKKLIMYG